MNIARQRLSHQRLIGPACDTPAAVVSWLGAVQAQDYLGALWAVGLRMHQARQRAIEQALADRTIIRTWPMRGTLHFVPSADARWMLELLTPRVLAANVGRLQRHYGIDDAAIAQSRDVIVRALQGGRQLACPALYCILEQEHIATAGQRGLQILWWLAQEGLICFGARQGKQQTFVLLDEWAPQSRRLARDESLAVLAQRYFSSHGPATVKDFAWWSGLATADAQAGLSMAQPALVREIIDGRTYWLAADEHRADDDQPAAHLLPPFDELTVAYSDRSALVRAPDSAFVTPFVVLGPVLVVDGQIVGTWKRALNGRSLTISAQPFGGLSAGEESALQAAARRYSAFHEPEQVDISIAIPRAISKAKEPVQWQTS